MCLCNETNPNNVPIRSFTTYIGNNHNEILHRIESEIKKFIKENGKPNENRPYYFVADPYWRHKNRF